MKERIMNLRALISIKIYFGGEVKSTKLYLGGEVN
jgi:hypothetical protein